MIFVSRTRKQPHGHMGGYLSLILYDSHAQYMRCIGCNSRSLRIVPVKHLLSFICCRALVEKKYGSTQVAMGSGGGGGGLKVKRIELRMEHTS